MSYKPFIKPSGKPGRRSQKYGNREKKGQQPLPGLSALTPRQESLLEAGNGPQSDDRAPMGGWGRAKRQNAAKGTPGPATGKGKP